MKTKPLPTIYFCYLHKQPNHSFKQPPKTQANKNKANPKMYRYPLNNQFSPTDMKFGLTFSLSK